MLETTPLIPRRVLFGNPDIRSVTFSPDGRQIAYLAPVNGILNVWVGPAEQVSAARPVTQDTGRGIRVYAWAYDNRHLLYAQDEGGDENWRLYSIDVARGETRDLTPVEGARAETIKLSPRHPGEILVGLNDLDPAWHSVYRIDLASGARRLVYKNESFAGFLADDDLTLRLALKSTPDGGTALYKPDGQGGWKEDTRLPMEDALTTHPIGFDASGETLYMVDSRGRNTGALFSIPAEGGAPRLLAEDRRADAGEVIIHPSRRTVQAVAFDYERKQWHILDPEIAPDLEYLRTVAEGDLHIADRTLDDQRWIVTFTPDDGPQRIYSYDRLQKKAAFLFTDRRDLEGQPLVHMRPVVIRSRDGLDLVSYLTLPPGAELGQKLPTVLFVHGGPWGRDVWGYDPFHQLLANRGYAVLSVNYRGSTGFGKAFINASNREWAGKMHDDLVDATQWLFQQGIADPERTAIMGGSYGGYATLVGLTFTPELFACGVDIVGPSNLVTLLETIPPYWKPMLDMFINRVGDITSEEGRAFLTSRSPLTYAERICRPLLIGQGANDPRVKRGESDRIVAAMKAKGIPVTYLLYPDEGHGFARPENWLSFNAVAEAFLADCLGGRYEPVGEDFKGSSIQVLEGSERVPGLKEAMGSE